MFVTSDFPRKILAYKPATILIHKRCEQFEKITSMTKKKAKNKKIKDKKYKGFLGAILKLIEVENTTQKILKFILAVIIIPIVYWIISDIYNRFQERELIKQKIETADLLFESEQYDKAYLEYNDLIKSFNENEHSDSYFDLLDKIGNSLLNQNESSSKLKEAILNFNLVKEKLDKDSEQYFSNQLHLVNAYFNLFQIQPKNEYLEKMNSLLKGANPKNEILYGLKYYFTELYFQSKYDFVNEREFLDSTMIYINKAENIFTNQNSPNINLSLINDKANVLINYFHLDNDREYLLASKEYYQKNYARTSLESQRTDFAMSQFGLAHCFMHLYEKDSINEYLYKANELIRNSHLIYNKDKNPKLYYSSLSTYANVLEHLGKLEKNTEHFKQSIKFSEQTFDFYKPDYFESDYYKTKYNLADTYFEFYLMDNNPTHLKNSISILENINSYYSFDKQQSIKSNIVGLLGANYRLLSKHENKKANLHKGSRILNLPKRTLLEGELTDEEIIHLGKTLSAYNSIAYLRTKDSLIIKYVNYYRMLSDMKSDAEGRKEAYDFLQTIETMMDEVN